MARRKAKWPTMKMFNIFIGLSAIEKCMDKWHLPQNWRYNIQAIKVVKTSVTLSYLYEVV